VRTLHRRVNPLRAPGALRIWRGGTTQLVVDAIAADALGYVTKFATWDEVTGVALAA
jgi:hypothetical protein